jgi:hypothetical protein
MEAIVNAARDKIKDMNKKDVVVIWGGANDISKNNSKDALNGVCKFVRETNIYIFL